VKRLRIRHNLMRVLRLSIGAVMFSTLWAMSGRKDEWNGWVFFLGLLGFFVLVGWVFHEMNVAVEAANIRIDREQVRNDAQDVRDALRSRRIAALERRLGLDADVFRDDDTPPYGRPIIRPEDDVR
jgi:hypothetical protein